MRPVWLVVSRSVGNHPRWASAEQPDKNNAPADVTAEILKILARRLLVRSCELTDGPSSCYVQVRHSRQTNPPAAHDQFYYYV